MLLYPLSRPTCILFVDSHKGKQKRRLAWKNANFCLHKLVSFVFEKNDIRKIVCFFLTKRRKGKWERERERETGNGKRETGNWGRENENKTFLNPLSPDYQKPHCRFSILICSHILLCFPFLRDRSSFPVPDFPFLVLDILQVPPLITWGKLQKALHNISYK